MKKYFAYIPNLNLENEKAKQLYLNNHSTYQKLISIYNSELYLKYSDRINHIISSLYTDKFYNKKYRTKIEYIADGKLYENKFEYKNKSKFEKKIIKLQYLPRSSQFSKKRYGRHYRKFYNLLIECSFVESNENYSYEIDNKNCKSFRLTQLVNSLDFEKIEVTDKELINNLERSEKENNDNLNYYENYWFKNVLPKFKIRDINACHADIESITQDEIGFDKDLDEVKKCCHRDADDIQNGNYRISIGKNGERLFSNITNFPRRIRKKWLTDNKGNTFIELDIANCQPWLIKVLMKRYGWECDSLYNELTQEEDKYKALYAYIAKNYYSEILNEFGIDAAIDQVKKDMLQYFFSTNTVIKHNKKNMMNVIFKVEFPNVYNFLYEFKGKIGKRGGKVLASTLQKMESGIFVKKVLRNLLQLDTVFATIHDSVLITEEYVEYAKYAILKEFKKLTDSGIVPVIRIKKLDNSLDSNSENSLEKEEKTEKNKKDKIMSYVEHPTFVSIIQNILYPNNIILNRAGP